MRLFDLIPGADVVCALTPDELGLRMLPMLARRYEGSPPTVSNPGLQIKDFLLDAQLGDYPDGRKSEVRVAVTEAWAWLEGQGLLIQKDPIRNTPTYPNHTRELSRRALQMAREPEPRRSFSVRRLPKEVLHAAIREDVWALYHRGKYDTAVLEAMKAVEVAVRDAAGLSPNDIGVKLIGAAFNDQTGPLTDMDTPESERRARAALFSGAIGSYKNPHSHRYVNLDDPDEAAEIIMLANHLLRIVDTRREARTSGD